MDCKTCKENKMNVPFIVHEAAMARMERMMRRLWVAIMVLVMLLAATNIGWAYYESQFVDETTVEQDVETGEGNAYVAGIGDVDLGES